MKFVLLTFLLSALTFASANAANIASCGSRESYRCRPCAPLNCFESPPTFCPIECQDPGCYCDDGYLRNDDGICILSDECFNKCGVNEVDLLCKPCAAIECGDVAPEMCLAQCVDPGCYCAPGYLRQDGACIPQELC